MSYPLAKKLFVADLVSKLFRKIIGKVINIIFASIVTVLVDGRQNRIGESIIGRFSFLSPNPVYTFTQAVIHFQGVSGIPARRNELR